MARIMTISLCEEDYLFLRELMSKGSKASTIFSYALGLKRMQIENPDINPEIAFLKTQLAQEQLKHKKKLDFIEQCNLDNRYKVWNENKETKALLK